MRVVTHTVYKIVSLWQKIHNFSILFYEARVCVTLKIDMFSSFLCVSGIAVRSWHWPLMGIQKRNLTMTTLTLKTWTVCQSWQQEPLLHHHPQAPPAGKIKKQSTGASELGGQGGHVPTYFFAWSLLKKDVCPPNFYYH